MKKIISTIALLIAIISSVTAQRFEGIATYTSQSKFDSFEGIDFSGGGSNPGENDALNDQIKQLFLAQSKKEYTLEFNQNESLFQEIQALEKPNGQPQSVQVFMSTSGGENAVNYKNLKEKTSLDETSIFGKKFLVSDEITSLDWKLSKETKKIGGYTCYKATTTSEIQTSNVASFSRSETPGQNNTETKTQTVTTTAWYTPEIPVQNGPAEYQGLPGLILELNSPFQSFLCNKIVLNPAKRIKIEAPSKGKKVTKKEFDEISKKKFQQMQEDFGSGGFQIIGG